MPDITEEILRRDGLGLDPKYYPLPPTVDDLLTFESELEAEGNGISFEWADGEVKNGLLGFVRAGLVARKIKIYKLYRKIKLDSFRDYCEKILGKSLWTINRLIDAARVVIELATFGFKFLPTCEAQARPLTKFNGDELKEKWQAVISTLPPTKMTSDNIAAIVGGEPAEEKQKQLRIDSEVYETLSKKATESGLSTHELLKKLVREYQPEDPAAPEEMDETANQSTEEEEEAEAEIEPITREQMEAWVADMQDLISQRYGLSASPALNTS